jgi:hypothetical protein
MPELVLLLRCSVISGLSTGAILLIETESTPLMPIFVVVYLRAVAGLTSVPTMSIGTNAPNYDNVIPAAVLAGLDVQGEYFRIPVGTALAGGVFRGMSPSSSVKLYANVTVAAVATTYDTEVQVIGAYV